MLQGFISLFSTPARAYAFLLAIALITAFIIIWRIRCVISNYSDKVSAEYEQKGRISLFKKIFLKKDADKNLISAKAKKRTIVVEGREIELDETDIEVIKGIVDENARKIAMEKQAKAKLEALKKKEEQKKEIKKSAEEKKKEQDKQETKKKEEQELKKKEQEEKAREEELSEIRDEGRQVIEKMASRIADYEARYQSLEQIEDILSYKDDIRDASDIKEKSDLDRLLGRQNDLENAFDWHKDMDMSKSPVYATKQVALDEEQIKGFLDNMMSEIVPLVDRGLSDAQITRTLANKNDYQIPTHEIVPMLESVRSCLGILDSKEVNAKIRFTDASYDISAARSALLRGDTKDAIKIMEDRMKLLEKTADSMSGNEKSQMQERAADLSRHIAVLVKVDNIKDSFKFINHSLDLDNDNIKTLGILGYMNLRDNDLFAAEKSFLKALENANQNDFWAKLAKDGMETVNSLKDEEKKSIALSMEKEEEKQMESAENIKNMMAERSKQMQEHKKSMYRLVVRVRANEHTR